MLVNLFFISSKPCSILLREFFTSISVGFSEIVVM